jgi:hypothetical protein
MKPLRIAAFSHGSVGGNPAGVVITEMDARDYLGGWVGDVNTSLRHSWKGSCDCCAPTSLLSIAAVPHAAPLPSLPLARINEIGVAIMHHTFGLPERPQQSRPDPFVWFGPARRDQNLMQVLSKLTCAGHRADLGWRIRSQRRADARSLSMIA